MKNEPLFDSEMARGLNHEAGAMWQCGNVTLPAGNEGMKEWEVSVKEVGLFMVNC